ncbi:MAG: DUF1989 domain-containing protein [Vulcanimicrobiaceae bacterium]
MIVVPAGHGRAFRLGKGERLSILNTHGQQVVDTWALHADDPSEMVSMEHTRSCLDRLRPSAGDNLFTNRRRPLVLMESDTSPGIHDTLLSACDQLRYDLLGFAGTHRSCAQNFYEALAELGIKPARVPAPLNMFERVIITETGALEIAPPLSRPGDTVVLRAVEPAIVIVSACPMDIALTNGLDRTPKDIAVRLDGLRL